MTQIEVGQVWKKSDHERITVDGVSEGTISGVLSDTRAVTSAVWVGKPADFEKFELLSDSPSD